MKACPCPTCGHVPAAKRTKPAAAPIDLASLTDAELFKYRARTAPYCDVQFFLDCGAGLSPELIEAVEALAAHVNVDGAFTGVTRSDFYRQYYALSSRRRVERSEADYTRIMAAAALAGKAKAWAAMLESGIDIGARILEAAVMSSTLAAFAATVQRHSEPLAA